MVAIRLFELWLNRRHVARLRARGATYHGKAGLEAIVLAQVLFLAGILVEGVYLPPHPTLNATTIPLLGLALAALALRHWCIFTLGDRWTIAVFTLPDAPLVDRGPYRFLRHPNYVAVAVEFLALTAALQDWVTMAVAGLVLLPALAYRVGQENQALHRIHEKTGPRQAS